MISITVRSTDNVGYILEWQRGNHMNPFGFTQMDNQPHTRNNSGTEVHTSVNAVLQRIGQLLDREHERDKA